MLLFITIAPKWQTIFFYQIAKENGMLCATYTLPSFMKKQRDIHQWSTDFIAFLINDFIASTTNVSQHRVFGSFSLHLK